MSVWGAHVHGQVMGREVLVAEFLRSMGQQEAGMIFHKHAHWVSTPTLTSEPQHKMASF
jgi:hypothetical protein